MGQKMTGIADAIRLYNTAFALALDQLEASHSNSAATSVHLAVIVRMLIKAGGLDSSVIAAEAVDHLKRNPKP
jgi:asparagine synthetase B (glutamine-hydrolysing)